MTAERRARGWAIGALLVFAAAALGYAGGRVHAWLESREARTQFDAKLEEQQRAHQVARQEQAARLTRAEGELSAAAKQSAQQADLVELYEGYRRMQLALGSLDARNFGIAQSHLRAAEQLLLRLSKQVPNLAPLVTTISGTNITVAGNLGQQRQALGSMVAQLDRVLEEQQNKHALESARQTPAIEDGGQPEAEPMVGVERERDSGAEADAGLRAVGAH